MSAHIFLYTDAARIDARTRKEMIAAGYLPVKVATLDAVKFLEPAPVVPGAEVSEVLRAALEALIGTAGGNFHRAAWERFAKSLGERLIVAHDEAEAARKVPG